MNVFRPLAVASVLLLAHAMLPAFAQDTASPEAAAPAPSAPKASNPAAPPAGAAINTKPLPPKQVAWSFDGPFGTFDRGALQRGFQAYKDVCSACHALNHIAFRNLAEPGGPGFSPEQVKALAASYRVAAGPNEQGQSVDTNGQPLTRSATPADYFPPPFPNEQSARASNNGALPPDLSLIVKARDGHSDYVYSILTGFGQQPPANEKIGAGRFYNPYFRGHQIVMPPPLMDGSVMYVDGTMPTLDQEARDVVTFLTWASDPKMEERKRTGFNVMIFLFVLGGLLYFSYQRVWYGKH
jgi:ubiquinol-cytochrome c reductase cytochrome b/c1 subunit